MLLFSFKLSNLLVDTQIGLLLLESLSILGHFALLHPENQEVLRWGKSPTILHKVRITTIQIPSLGISYFDEI